MSLDQIQFVLFDMAGTTVDDRAAGPSLVLTAISDAFAEAGLRLEMEQIKPHRGKEKREMIRSLLRASHQSDAEIAELSPRIYARFVEQLHAAIGRMKEMEGANETFRFLKARGIRVGVGSGFPQEVVDAIVRKLGWQEQALLDYIGSAEQVGVSRPDPAMIRLAMTCLHLGDPRRVLKVGDTVVDIQEGRNAGTWTAGVLTGSQSEHDLRGAGADFVLASVAEIPSLFTKE